MNLIENILKKEFNLKEFQVTNTIKLIDDGNTIPFIARYRKEMTGELSDDVLRDFYDRLIYLRNLEIRKDEVMKSIEEQGKLDDELKLKIQNAETMTEVEDLYRPFKPKKRTRATIAKEKGLEPLAIIIYEQIRSDKDLNQIAMEYVNPDLGVNNVEEAIAGAMDIIAEIISDNADYRKEIREFTENNGMIQSKAVNSDEKTVYDMYYEFEESVSKVPSHRVLAINRGEKEQVLKVKIVVDEDTIIFKLNKEVIKENSPYKEVLENTVLDSYKRLIQPSIEREVRANLTEMAEEQAIKVFGVNVKNLLLQPPLKDATIMGFDPAYRTGCKIAVIDNTGKLLATTTVYPTAPQNDVFGARSELLSLINKYKINMIAIGNGTASRESEMFVADMIKDVKHPIYYAIVSEAGASVYSASKLASEEYPDINVSLRGAISIARRLQDPMAELVKIDPKSIGVGQYQHDVNQKRLDETLTGVVEDAVNNVGVDLNTATPSLLRYIAGITKTIATNIVKYRDEMGVFKNRQQLLKVAKLGQSAFTQCAGFLRISNGTNPLDNTAVHPESYDVAEKILEKAKECGGLDSIKPSDIAKELNVGEPTVKDIISELKKPGRDPRDEMPKPILRNDVLKIEDLYEGMVLTGTVRNVIDFGAFVDIGVKTDGLVHISQICDKYIKNPSEVLAVGDIVKVKVLSVDKDKHKISLTMKEI